MSNLTLEFSNQHQSIILDSIPEIARTVWNDNFNEPEGKLLRVRSLPFGYNAPMESFWATLKNELVFHRSYQTRQMAIREIAEYIEIFITVKEIKKNWDMVYLQQNRNLSYQKLLILLYQKSVRRFRWQMRLSPFRSFSQTKSGGVSINIRCRIYKICLILNFPPVSLLY